MTGTKPLQVHPPLVFHGGRYAEARERTAAHEPAPVIDLDRGAFTDDFLFYLVSRAHFQSFAPTLRRLSELKLDQTEYMVLARLSMEAPLIAAELAEQLEHTGAAPSPTKLDLMVERRLLIRTDNAYELAEAGRNAFLQTLSVAKAFEEDLVERFTASELADAKRFLRKLVDLTGAGVPIAWR